MADTVTHYVAERSIERERAMEGDWLVKRAARDDATRREVTALMAYAEDAAGGLMSPRFARLRPGMAVGAAVLHPQPPAEETA